MKVKQNLRVRIDADAMERIWHWTDLAAGEFSCLGTVTEDMLVGGVQLFDQICTAASTELDQDALAKFLVTHPAPEPPARMRSASVPCGFSSSSILPAKNFSRK